MYGELRGAWSWWLVSFDVSVGGRNDGDGNDFPPDAGARRGWRAPGARADTMGHASSVDVGRDVRRRDRAVRVVLDAVLAAQERARDLAINIVVEAALRGRRRRRGPVAPARTSRP